MIEEVQRERGKWTRSKDEEKTRKQGKDSESHSGRMKTYNVRQLPIGRFSFDLKLPRGLEP